MNVLTPTKMRLSEAREQKEIAFERECKEMAKINAYKKEIIEYKKKAELERIYGMLDQGYYNMASNAIKRLIKLDEELR